VMNLFLEDYSFVLLSKQVKGMKNE